MKQMVHTQGVDAARAAKGAVHVGAGDGIVAVFFLPDAGIEDAVFAVFGDHLVTTTATKPLRIAGNDRVVGVLLPVDQQRVGGRGDAVAGACAVVDGDHAIVLDQGLAAVAVAFHVRVQRDRQVAPVDQVVTDRVAPANALFAIRGQQLAAGQILEEEMESSLPFAKAVGVVHEVAGRREMVERARRVSGQAFARGDVAQYLPVALEGLELRFQ